MGETAPRQSDGDVMAAVRDVIELWHEVLEDDVDLDCLDAAFVRLEAALGDG